MGAYPYFYGQNFTVEIGACAHDSWKPTGYPMMQNLFQVLKVAKGYLRLGGNCTCHLPNYFVGPG